MTGQPHLTTAQAGRCANPAEHIYGPDGYDEWYAWADRMEETHVGDRCAACGLWALWTPREDT